MDENTKEKVGETNLDLEKNDESIKNNESVNEETETNIKTENENTVEKETEIEDEKAVEKDEEIIIPEKITNLKTLGPFIASKDNAQNTVYVQDIPEICKTQPCMLGVDEAGRGPVLGPMVYGIAFCPIEEKQVLIDLGCADSKQLTEEKREIIFDEIHTKDAPRSCLGWAVELISPNVISSSMNRRSKCSLNEVSMNSAIDLIHRAVDLGVNIAEVYVDTVGPPEKYQEKLKKIFPQFSITVAKKADSTYPIVSAASICAKVARDHALKFWRFPEFQHFKEQKRKAPAFGSGYPGDPVTKRFLSENIDLVFGYPRLVRFSWATAENALLGKAFDMEFDQPNNEKQKYEGAKLTQFFKGQTKTGEVKREKCKFFKERFLNSVFDF